MKNVMKIFYIALCLIIALSPIILADVDGINVNPDTNQTVTTNVGNTVVGVIKVVGIFVSVGALMVIGIKYMMGSAEEKAEYKKVMIPYIIGAVLVFAASVFADKIATFASTLFG